MNKVLIVKNINAGRKKAIKYKKAVIKYLLSKSINFTSIDIYELNSININDYDTVLVLGGDGTISKLLPYLINSNINLGIIPCGTANLLAAKLGISENIKSSLKIIDSQKRKKIDVFEVNNKLSILRVGFGFDADIICKTPQSLKNKFGYFSYFIAGILFALRLKLKNYKLIIDGNNYEYNASCIIVANAANMYKNLISIASKNMIDDGILDIFIIKTSNPFMFFIELLRIFFKVYKNNIIAEYVSGKNIQISNDFTNFHIDGEKQKIKGNIKINVTNNHINIIANN